MIIEIALGIVLAVILLTQLDLILGIAKGVFYILIPIALIALAITIGINVYETISNLFLPYKSSINSVLEIIGMTLFWGFVFAAIAISIYKSYKNRTLLKDTVTLIKKPMFIVAVITLSFFLYIAYFVE